MTLSVPSGRAGPDHYRFEFENEVDISSTKIPYDHFQGFPSPDRLPMYMQRELRFARDEIRPVHYRFEIENEVDVNLPKILYDHLKKIVSRLASHIHAEGASLRS